MAIPLLRGLPQAGAICESAMTPGKPVGQAIRPVSEKVRFHRFFQKAVLTSKAGRAYKPLIDGEGAAGEPFGSLWFWPRRRHPEEFAGNGWSSTGSRGWKSRTARRHRLFGVVLFEN